MSMAGKRKTGAVERREVRGAPADLVSRLESSLASFGPAERRVAEVALADLGFVAEANIADIAARAGVSEPTVVRFCRRLGCAGVRDFKLKLAQNLAVGLQYLRPDTTLEAAGTLGLVDHVIGVATSALQEARRQLDPAALAAGERLQRLVEDALRQAQVVADLRALGIRLVAAEGMVLLLQAGEFADGLVTELLVRGRFHQLLLLGHAALDLVQASCGEHALARGLLDVALAGILREVTNGAGARHRAAVGLGFSGQDAHRRGFSRTIAAD